MRMTIVVMIAARKTKPPKTPKAMIPPRFSCACRVSLRLFSTGLGSSAPAGEFCTFAESGISLSIGGRGLSSGLSWGSFFLGRRDRGESGEKSIGFLGKGPRPKGRLLSPVSSLPLPGLVLLGSLNTGRFLITGGPRSSSFTGSGSLLLFASTHEGGSAL